MKKGITFTTAFLMFFSAFAQQITVEEIYDNFITAMGGSEKLNAVVNKMVVSSHTSEHSITGAVIDQGSTKGGIINLWDYAGQQTATMTKQYPSDLNGNELTFTRILNANGKSTMLLSNGKKVVTASGEVDRYLADPFPETVIQPGSKVLPNEIIDGNEFYVVNYERTTSTGLKFDAYEYFDTNSGLKIGFKEVIKQEDSGSVISTTALQYYEDYKEVEGILVSHTLYMHKSQEIIGQTNMTTIINEVIESSAIVFNIDVEDFKQNCFQNPEECFAKYEKN